MAILLLHYRLHFFFFFCFTSTLLFVAQSSPNFSCSDNSFSSSCQTYVTYFANPPKFLFLQNIANLFRVSPLSIAQANNLINSEETPLLVSHELLLIPVTCGCFRNRYFANITYEIEDGDTYYFVSTKLFQNLTNWPSVQEINPTLDPTLLQIGQKVTFPLSCKCPSQSELDKKINNFITYVWQPKDDVVQISKKFHTSSTSILTENNYKNMKPKVHHPILIPVSQLPVLPHSNFLETVKSKSIPIFVLKCIGAALLILIIVIFLVFAYCHFYKKNKLLNLINSFLEKDGLIVVEEYSSTNSSGTNLEQKKLLFDDIKVITDATMNFNESYQIGRSVYKATINGQVFAVKKTKEDVKEELMILQTVNHINIVKLMGFSSYIDGTSFLVYKHVKNGSLDKWLYSNSPSMSILFLTWTQRLHIALDIALGLQYMHEHIEPSIVHRDIRTTNILLESNFKAKIANLSTAMHATNSVSPKVDVFGFGCVLLELLSGKKSMGCKGGGNETVMLWKDIRKILLDSCKEKKEKSLTKWIDPKLEGSYSFDDALGLAELARACTLDMPLARPTMAEIVFNLSVIIRSSSSTSTSVIIPTERSWTCKLESQGVGNKVMSPVIAR